MPLRAPSLKLFFVAFIVHNLPVWIFYSCNNLQKKLTNFLNEIAYPPRQIFININKRKP